MSGKKFQLIPQFIKPNKSCVYSNYTNKERLWGTALQQNKLLNTVLHAYMQNWMFTHLEK